MSADAHAAIDPNEVSVGWMRYTSESRGCITHACAPDSVKSFCGLVLTERLGDSIVEHRGVVGCKRCAKAMHRLNVLPIAVEERIRPSGDVYYVLAER